MRKHNKTQAHRKAKARTLMAAFSSSQAFHQTPCRRAQKIPMRMQEEQEFFFFLSNISSNTL
jgi:deoxyhypusine synthase